MKAGLYWSKRQMADPDPPTPVPFPIKIVADPLPPLDDIVADTPTGKRNDLFYDAWDKFLAIEPKRAKAVTRSARRVEEQKQAIEQTPSDGLQIKENAVSSLQQATEACKAKVAAIVAECQRLNRKYVDYTFNLEAGPDTLQSLSGAWPSAVQDDAPPWIKRVEDIFDKPEFFIDGAAATDVHQGGGGDCWFLAALMAISAKKDLIDKLYVARDEKIGVYGFVFYRDGEWIHEVIDDKLYLKVGDDDDLAIVRDWDKEGKEGRKVYMEDEKLKKHLQKGGESLYFSHCKSSETWLPLIEKAYAKAHGDYSAIEGGFASEGIEDLTGGIGAGLNPEDIMDKERFWRDQLSQVNVKYLFGGGTKRRAVKGMVGGHAYAVLKAWEEGDLKLLQIRNPWGDTEWSGDWSDGSKLWTPEMMTKLGHTFGDDGIFWMSYADFLKHFPSLNRVRLFDDTWSVAQQWTCVKVPWTVDYLDTKFQFTISEKGPVVIALSQPDDRYFNGLRGRFVYSMHFRVYNEGEEESWIVRSMDNSGNETMFTRSVSAEIEDLEPGTYDVVFKITGMRVQALSTPQENIVKYAIDRKEKLLYVSRRYDYAQSKGNLRAMELSVKRQAVLEERTKTKDGLKKARVLNKGEKERIRKRKQRVDAVMKGRRRTFAETQIARSKERKQRKKAKKEAKAAQTLAEDEAKPKGDTAAAETDTPPSESEAPKAEDDATPGGEEPQNETQAADPAETQTKDTGKPETEGLSNKLSKLTVEDNDAAPSTDDPPVSPLSAEAADQDEDEDEEYDSELEAPEDVSSDDFDWDSDMDGPLYTSDEEDAKNEIFGEDPWNALCVLGLRVYSQNSEAKVTVIKSADGS